jgi:trehalose 6-phosphate phosphatase
MRRNLLALRYREYVRRVSAPSALLAFDFDGTLAPIVETPAAAAMRPATRERLHALAKQRRVAIITGRALADIQPRLDGIPLAALVGNHGIEPSPQMASARETVAAWVPALLARTGALPGVVLEDKGQSLAVHYRHAASPVEARAAILDAVRSLGAGVRLVEGLEVVNLVPAGAPTKGDALLRLCREFEAGAVLYVGDEETDEDAFAVLDDAVSLGVRVGRNDRSRAPYFVHAQADVDTLLDVLLASVERHDAAARQLPVLARSVAGPPE